MHYKDYDINIRINIKSWLLGAYSLRKLQEFTYLASEFGMHPKTKNYFEYGKAAWLRLAEIGLIKNISDKISILTKWQMALSLWFPTMVAIIID